MMCRRTLVGHATSVTGTGAGGSRRSVGPTRRRATTVPILEELLGLELSGWNALSSSGSEASTFYRSILDERCLMLLPGGRVIEGREEAVSSMQQGPPWDSFELDHARILELVDDVAVLAYRARARRGEARYRAWITSTYVRRGRAWRLTLHQHTPDDD